MSEAELRVNRRNTKAFISAHPTTLALTPRTRHKDGKGIRFVDGKPRPAVTVRLIDQSSTSSPTPGLLPAADGLQRKVNYQLLAEYDAQVELYDSWTDASGIRWEVVELFPDNGYERRALVCRMGES